MMTMDSVYIMYQTIDNEMEMEMEMPYVIWRCKWR